MKKVGIFGCTGYAANQLLKHLVSHSEIEIVFIASDSNHGKTYETMYPAFRFLKSLPIMTSYAESENLISECDLVFSALPAGMSYEIEEKCRRTSTKLIDLSSDFRMKGTYETTSKVVYGLSEIYRTQIKEADIIANPGCYATSILLPIIPLLKCGLIDESFISDSKSGTSGAGRSLRQDTLYCEVNENFKAYHPFTHRHVPEMKEVILDSARSVKNIDITFVPHLLPINRGILSTIYATLKKGVGESDINEAYEKFYKDETFVHHIGSLPDIRQAAYSNNCVFGTQIHGDKLLIVSVIDNLVKGAAGQAVQNMNIMFGFDESMSLY